MGHIKSENAIKFIGRLTDTTKYYQNNDIALFQRAIQFFFDKRRHKYIFFGRPRFIYSDMGDQYVVFEYKVTTHIQNIKYYTVETDGCIEEAEGSLIKRFSNYTKMFP